MKGALLAAALLAAALAFDGVARAETVIDLPKTSAQLTLLEGWTRTPNPPAGTVEVAKHAAGHVLVVMRADVPNPDAWVSDKKQAYADKVERGIKAKIAGYKRVAKKLGEANGIPALDVEARRDDGATIVVRVLLYRTYALTLSVEVPPKGDVEVARAVVKTFTPPKATTPASTPTTSPTTTAPPTSPRTPAPTKTGS